MRLSSLIGISTLTLTTKGGPAPDQAEESKMFNWVVSMDVSHLILGATQWVGLLFPFPCEEMEVQRGYMCPGSSASKQQRSAHPHRCCSPLALRWTEATVSEPPQRGGLKFIREAGFVHIKLTFQQTSFLRQSVVDIAALWYSETKEKADPLKWEWLILFGIKRTIILRTNDRFPLQNWVLGLCWLLSVTVRHERTMIEHSTGPTKHATPGPWERGVEYEPMRTSLQMQLEAA